MRGATQFNVTLGFRNGLGTGLMRLLNGIAHSIIRFGPSHDY